jgi:hypothetical protein
MEWFRDRPSGTPKKLTQKEEAMHNKRNHGKSRKVIVLSIIAAFAVSAIAVAKGPTIAAAQLPRTIFWGTKDVGTGLYQAAATMSEILAPELGSKIRLIPGNDLEINIMMRQGRAHLACWGQDAFWSGTGLGVYATPAFGPQPTRLLGPASWLPAPILPRRPPD